MTRLIVLSLLTVALATPVRAADAADPSLYEQKVLPLLKRHCYQCHSHDANKAKGGLVLDSRASMLSGGDSGPAIVPGKPDASLLIQAVKHQKSELQMPPKGKLDDPAIETLVTWVKLGAPTPKDTATAKTDAGTSSDATKTHWAFQPLRKPALPELHTPQAAVRNPIDTFVLARLEAAGIGPVGPADRRTLIRRLYLDLIGLPPAPAAVEAFVNDPSPGAVAKLVDRLLQMPEIGERWGRHWLDVARYADSNGGGSESNNTHDNAWRFRDYVITAFNEDKPFDRFVTEQIAGDLLDWTSDEQRRTQLIATGYLLLGPKAFGTGDYEQFRLDTIDEQLDTIGKSLLGLALGCARCHDHKFDPIPTRDYYALTGILASTQSVHRAKGWRQGRTWHSVPLPIEPDMAKALQEAYAKRVKDTNEAKDKAQAEMKELRKRLGELKEDKAPPEKIAEAERAIEALQGKIGKLMSLAKVLPIVSVVPSAMAVEDEPKPVDENIRVRGVPKSKGELVPRGVLTLFPDRDPNAYRIPANASGRLELARWLTDAERGAGHLVARVTVNRVWGHLLGRPIVGSVDNFGVTGEKPTHPELLDHLAATFVEDGWSVKRLIRRIVLSDTYQRAAADDAAAKSADPDNALLWRYQAHRLDVEVLRDSLLALSDQLDRKRGGPTLQHQGLVSFDSDFIVLDTPSPFRRRTVYLPIFRDAFGLDDKLDAMSGMLETFDFADPNVVSGRRGSTTVPTQALFLMNSPFMAEQAKATAQRLLADKQLTTDEQRVDHLFRSALGRPATEGEVERSLAYVRRFVELESRGKDPDEQRLEAWASFCQAVFGSNEFLFLN